MVLPSMANDRGRVMTEAERLLREIREHGDIIGRDAANQTIIQLAVDQPTLDSLMAFGADAAESEDGGDDEPYEGPRTHACWFEAATQRPTITSDAAPDPFRKMALDRRPDAECVRDRIVLMVPWRMAAAGCPARLPRPRMLRVCSGAGDELEAWSEVSRSQGLAQAGGRDLV